MFISPAFAQAATTATSTSAGANDMLMSVLPFIFIFIIMYFLILRPQQKRMKDHQMMIKNLRKGDVVVTNGGMVGKITKVIDDEEVEVQLAEGFKVRQLRAMITQIRSKSDPVDQDNSDKK
jgi:preprotein translocase subunit YajC